MTNITQGFRMKIQVNTDDNIAGREALASHVSATVQKALDRFREHITRVELHLSDENSAKNGKVDAGDQRCLLEVRLEGRQPVAVTDQAATLHQAVQGAADKMARLLDTTFGRLRDQRVPAPDLPVRRADPAQP